MKSVEIRSHAIISRFWPSGPRMGPERAGKVLYGAQHTQHIDPQTDRTQRARSRRIQGRQKCGEHFPNLGKCLGINPSPLPLSSLITPWFTLTRRGVNVRFENRGDCVHPDLNGDEGGWHKFMRERRVERLKHLCDVVYNFPHMVNHIVIRFVTHPQYSRKKSTFPQSIAYRGGHHSPHSGAIGGRSMRIGISVLVLIISNTVSVNSNHAIYFSKNYSYLGNETSSYIYYPPSTEAEKLSFYRP